MSLIRSAAMRKCARVVPWLVLAACCATAPAGAATSGPPGGFQRVVVFGDSLSDDGAYTLGAVVRYRGQAPFHVPFEKGGQFSVNSAESANWTDRLAARLGLHLSPNLVGFRAIAWETYLRPGGVVTNIDDAACAFDPGAGDEVRQCTNHAQGGSRVVHARGVGYERGALTYPVTRQWQRHLAQFGAPGERDLVIVLAGSNDVFAAFSASQAATGRALLQAEAGERGGAVSDTGALRAAAQGAALADARDDVIAAADALSLLVADVVARGAPYVVVGTLPDSALSPYGQGLGGGTSCDRTDPGSRCYALSQLVDDFNARLRQGLSGQKVQWLDVHELFERQIADPGSFGLDNVSQPWCDPNTGTSLLCHLDTPNSAAGAELGNLPRWLFADDVHPTPIGHETLARQAWQNLQAWGWLDPPTAR